MMQLQFHIQGHDFLFLVDLGGSSCFIDQDRAKLVTSMQQLITTILRANSLEFSEIFRFFFIHICRAGTWFWVLFYYFVCSYGVALQFLALLTPPGPSLVLWVWVRVAVLFTVAWWGPDTRWSGEVVSSWPGIVPSHFSVRFFPLLLPGFDRLICFSSFHFPLSVSVRRRG
jgi:hypothetical protein